MIRRQTRSTLFFFFNDTATTEIYTLSLHDALPISLIDEMDLVISVDTAVAHLSGAMGKKTFILLPYSPDYRWMLDRADSPWYPTATLFRQPSVGDWDSVISEIRQLLSD